MQTRAWFVGVLLLAACAEAPRESDWDMGPMPPVAALYDRAEPPATLEERGYYMTSDLAQALSAADTPVDFDFRTWANDPEIERQTFGLSEHPPENRAVVVTRFSYPGVGGGMNLAYRMCRLGPSSWKIEDVSAEPVPADDAAPASDAPPSLRQMLSLPARSPECG